MAGDFGIVYPLWNETADGGALLDRVVGEVGIDHITIPVVTGEWTQFRLRLLPESPYFHTEGGWHYPVNTKLYSSLSVRPKAAKWFGSRDVLGTLRDRAEERGLAVWFRLDVPRAVSALAHSDNLRQRNAWGEVYHAAPGCASHPELRELLRLTVEDLTRYDPIGFQFLGAQGDLLSALDTLNDLFPQSLVHTCFCASCRQIASAHVDPEQAARSVRAHTERLRRIAIHAATNAVAFTPDEILDAYDRAREDSLRGWMDGIADRLSTRRFLRVFDIRPEGFPTRRGIPEKGLCAPLARVAWDPLAVPTGTSERTAIYRYIERFRPKAAIATSLLQLLRFPYAESNALVRTVSDFASRGATFFDFEGLDEAPVEAVQWLKQAVRYARRE